MLQVSLCAYNALCVEAEPRAVQCDETTGDSTLRKSFHHQGSEQVSAYSVPKNVFSCKEGTCLLSTCYFQHAGPIVML